MVELRPPRWKFFGKYSDSALCLRVFEMNAFEQRWDEWKGLNRQIDAALASLREATAHSDLDQMKYYRAEVNRLCSDRIRTYMYLQALAVQHA